MSNPASLARRPWVWKLVGGLAIATLVAFYWSDLTLAGYIASVVGEEYPNGVVAHGAVHLDHLQKLSHRQPRQLARYLSAPWPEWRAVICHVLTYEEAVRERDCEGIPQLLTAVSLTDPNPHVRQLAARALRRVLPSCPDATTFVLAEASRAEPGPDRDELLRIVGDQRRSNNDLHSLLLGFQSSTNLDDRAIAFELMAKHFPRDVNVQLVKRLLADSGSQQGRITAVLEQVSPMRPFLIEGFLDGDDNDRIFALRRIIAVQEMLERYSPGSRPSRYTDSYFVLGSEVFDKAEQVAKRLFQSKDPGERALATTFYTITPTGGRFLLQAVWERSGADRRAPLDALVEFVRRITRVGGFQFTPQEADQLMSLLSDPDPHMRLTTLAIINARREGPERPYDPFPESGGPRNPSHRPTFLSLLDDPDDRIAWHALSYFTKIAPFEEAELPLIASAAERDLNTWQSCEVFNVMIERFPANVQTRELARKVIVANVSYSKVAQRFLEQSSNARQAETAQEPPPAFGIAIP